jgi:hypothetical protein
MKFFFNILLSLYFFISSCNGQKLNDNKITTPVTSNKKAIPQLKKMDTIYKQQHDALVLSLVMDSTSSVVTWKTILSSAMGNEIVLDTSTIEKSAAWKAQENVGESPVGLYNIASSYLKGEHLYIIYNRFGEVFVKKYTLLENDKFSVQNKEITEYLTSGGFGSMVNTAQFKKVNDDLYFLITAGQSFTGSKTNLYKINTTLFTIKKIKFAESIQRIKTFTISESAKLTHNQIKTKVDYYNGLTTSQKKENELLAPTTKELKDFEVLKEYVNSTNPYHLKTMSSQQDLYEQQETDLSNLGFSNFPLFTDDEKNIKNDDLNKFVGYVTELFKKEDTKKEIRNVKMLNYIFSKEQDNKIYFFFENQAVMEIIRYDNYTSEWLISRYAEKEIDTSKQKGEPIR